MRRLFTTRDAAAQGVTQSGLRWGERTGRWRRIIRSVYGEGSEDPSPIDRALAAVVATGGVAGGELAAVLHELDNVILRHPEVTVPRDRSHARPEIRRRDLPAERVVIVSGVHCTDGLQTLLDLAPLLSDAVWEQALESALRKRLTRIPSIVEALGHARIPGAARIRRVLALRPDGAPPTESLLETLMVQLARTVPGLPDPVRQLQVGAARVDLSWPDLGLFIELDGQQHKDQPVYDARRETAVVAATGWLCGRFTWTEVTRIPTSTARRLGELADQARRTPIAS